MGIVLFGIQGGGSMPRTCRARSWPMPLTGDVFGVALAVWARIARAATDIGELDESPVSRETLR